MENRIAEATCLFEALSAQQQKEILNLIRNLLQRDAEREQG